MRNIDPHQLVVFIFLPAVFFFLFTVCIPQKQHTAWAENVPFVSAEAESPGGE